MTSSRSTNIIAVMKIMTQQIGHLGYPNPFYHDSMPLSPRDFNPREEGLNFDLVRGI